MEEKVTEDLIPTPEKTKELTADELNEAKVPTPTEDIDEEPKEEKKNTIKEEPKPLTIDDVEVYRPIKANINYHGEWIFKLG